MLREYRHIKEYETEILSLKEKGLTKRNRRKAWFRENANKKVFQETPS